MDSSSNTSIGIDLLSTRRNDRGSYENTSYFLPFAENSLLAGVTAVAYVSVQLRLCKISAQYWGSRPRRKGRLQQMVVGAPMERIGIDITGHHPVTSRGYRYILTMGAYFTRWDEAFLLGIRKA